MAMFILLAPVFPDAASFGATPEHGAGGGFWPSPWHGWCTAGSTPPMRSGVCKPWHARRRQEVPAMAYRLLEEAKPSRRTAASVAASNWWQAQLHHRLLRLVRWADKTQLPERAQLPRMGLSLRAMQTAMLQLQQWRRRRFLPPLHCAERSVWRSRRCNAPWLGEGAAR